MFGYAGGLFPASDFQGGAIGGQRPLLIYPGHVQQLHFASDLRAGLYRCREAQLVKPVIDTGALASHIDDLLIQQGNQ